jgi:hypothetical protein
MTSGLDLEQPRRPCPHCDGSGVVPSLTAFLVFLAGALVFFTLGAFGVPALLRAESFRAIRDTTGLLFAGAVCVYLAYSSGLRGECDECDGTGYAKKPEPETPPSGEAIAIDQPCYKCGYNTRTLVVGGTCPECGATILSGSSAERYTRTRAAFRQFLLGNLVLLVLVVTGILIGGLQGVPFAFALFAAFLALWSGVAIVANREFQPNRKESLALVGAPALFIGWSIITVSLAAVAGIIIAGYYWFF